MKDQLSREPQKFEFFQAVRLLEREAQKRGRGAKGPVGGDVRPNDELLRFRANTAHMFPGCEIAQLRDDHGHLEMTVSFLGLTGPNGALPQHYTTLIFERMRKRDHTLQEFFDLFNHRAVSLFFRAWEKNHFPYAYERARQDQGVDLFTDVLYSLVGLGTGNLRQRLDVDDETFVYYAGQFTHQIRSASSLQAILQDYVGLPLNVEEFVGQWLYLDEENQSRLASAAQPEGQHVQLGTDTVLGDRVWDVESKFRIHIGPLNYAQFSGFLPSEVGLRKVAQLTRSFVGVEFDFEIQLFLHANDVPPCKLGDTTRTGPRLGWNTWIQSSPRDVDASDAVFTFAAI